MDTEVKKGRGRPKKVLTEEELNKPKKPRGRPKKVEIDKVVQEKKPRGRPKKEKVEIVEKEKKPRGRPKKVDADIKKVDTPAKPRGRPKKEVSINKEIDKKPRGRPKKIESKTEDTTKISTKQIQAEEKIDDLEKCKNYIKLQEKVQGIVQNREDKKVLPAKHLKENLLQENQPVEKPVEKPKEKLNISRPKTPLKKESKKQKPVYEKAPENKSKVIVVTGATSGMGFALVKNLVALGHIVIGVGRRPGFCKDAREEILYEYPDAKIHYLVADLSFMSQVRILADEIKAKVESLGRECIDVLIHNAASDMEYLKITYENREFMWATNYLAVFLLTKSLQPMLDKSQDARVITFTTHKAARRTKLDWKGIKEKNQKFAKKMYNQTKLADLMFALEYDHRNAEREDLHAYCIDPGNVNTTLRTKHASGIRKMFFEMWRKRGKTVEQGIETALYLALTDKLPKNVVFYANRKPVEASKFALNQNNRIALWRITEREID